MAGSLSTTSHRSGEQEGGQATVVVSLPGLMGPQDERGGEGEEGGEGGGGGGIMDGVREAGRSTVRGSEDESGAADGSALLPVEKWEAAGGSLQGGGADRLPSSKEQHKQQRQHQHQHQQHDASALLQGRQVAASMAPAVPGMVTLGMLPRSQWLSLSSIDVIKVTWHSRCSRSFLIIDRFLPFFPPPRTLAFFHLDQCHSYVLVTSPLQNSQGLPSHVSHRTFPLPACCPSCYQERNRPLEAPKKPEQAPFFLPSLPSLSGAVHFDSETRMGLGEEAGDAAVGVQGDGKGSGKKGGAKKRERGQLMPQSQLLTAVVKGSLSGNCE